jgi:hypothetical protein
MNKLKNFIIVLIHYILLFLQEFIPFNTGYDYSKLFFSLNGILFLSGIAFSVITFKNKYYISSVFLMIFSLLVFVMLFAASRGL